MKNSFWLILLSVAFIRCSGWPEKSLSKSGHSHTIWHYALRDSVTIRFQTDSLFHLTDLKSVWDDSNGSFGYEYKNSSIIISYYALSRPIDSPEPYDKILKIQRNKIKDAYPERKIIESKPMTLGNLDGAYTFSYEDKIKQINYEGSNQESQISIHILITVSDSTHDPNILLKDLVSSMTFHRKNN